MRAEEAAAESEIERSQGYDRSVKKVGKTLIGLAAGGIAGRIAPFLSQYIPTDLAIKGINKISPKLGEFLNKGMQSGLDVKEGLQYIKDNLGSQKQQKAPNQRSIIEQYSPELNQFLQAEIQKGRQPLEAGALAETSGKFKKAIADMVKDHKAPFSSILESVFGGQQQGQPQSQQQPQQGQGNNDQMIMAALEKVLSM